MKKTVASTCRTMILAGRSDGQIWSVLRRVFDIDDDKRRYIGWYRAEVRRRGLKTNKRVAKKHVEVNRRRAGYHYN